MKHTITLTDRETSWLERIAKHHKLTKSEVVANLIAMSHYEIDTVSFMVGQHEASTADLIAKKLGYNSIEEWVQRTIKTMVRKHGSYADIVDKEYWEE